MEKVRKYWMILMPVLLLLLSYPIYMGFSVIRDMLREGLVWKENFPKYVIPYTPIAISILVTAALLPLLLKRAGRYATGLASALAVGIFFLSEFLFEDKVIVGETILENWQMFMCYVPPEGWGSRTWTAVDVLMGAYSPSFKLHFYLISVILVLGFVNSIYGFGRMFQTGDFTRKKALTVQSVCMGLFLGLCILACFTAFYRDGEIMVSALSAALMGAFFILLGVTGGIYAGSFLIGRNRKLAVYLPAGIASALVLVMYVGEMCLLSWHLYRFGSGVLFDGIPGLVLAPVDLGIILLAGIVTWAVCGWLNQKKS